jgi:3-phenylpropionate/trans-cinnamate dioxygenase ferredoxin subunit
MGGNDVTNFVTVGTRDQFNDGDRIVVEINELYIAVFQVNGKLYAIEDVCTHDDGPLAEGMLIHEDDAPKIECPRHGAKFNLVTGKPTFPAVKAVIRYPVRIEGEEIQVDLAGGY